MKKIIKNSFLVILTFILLEIVVFIFKTYHQAEYKIIKSDKIFNVTEIYKNNNYYFKIVLNNKKYIFSYNNNFYKTKKVLTDIVYYENDDLSCIYPILKSNHYLDIICLQNNNLYSYDYVKEKIPAFVKELQKQGYRNSSWTISETTKRVGDIYVYQDNILDNTYIYLWKYNGFYSINNKDLTQLNIFNNDTYINNLGVKVDKYYFIPDYDSKYEYNKFYLINMTNNNINEMILKKKATITNDYYYNGIVNDKLYLFDVDNLIQYKISPKRSKYEVIGNSKLGGLYYDGSFKNKNIYAFKENKLLFKEKLTIPQEIKEYNEIFNYQDNYYYTYNNDVILYNSKTKEKMHLFHLTNISNLTLIENDLYFIKDNTLYFYNIYYGLKPLVIYDELQFNKTNRYSIYKK